MVRQPNGKLVLTATTETASGWTKMVVQRREQGGDLDPSFGSRGTVIVRKANSVSGLAVQADGGILLAVPPNSVLCGSDDSTIRRLAPSGASDPSFGKGDGSATVPFSIDRIAVDAEGRILVAGTDISRYCIKGPAPTLQLAVARLRPDGTLDSSFGDGGVAHLHNEDEQERNLATGLAIREDGTILVADHHSLLRLSADGALDPSFGKGGVIESAGSPKALLSLPGGEAVLATSATTLCCSKPDDFILSRYRPDGSLDTAFGSNGRATLDVAEFDRTSALALSPDGGIVLAGGAVRADDCGSGDCAFTPIVARFASDGALDPDFGQGGRVAVEFPGGSPGYSYAPQIAAVVIAPSGQIVAAGGAGSRSDAFIVARQPDGQVDPAFGEAGSIDEIRRLPSWTEPDGLAIGPSGKIFVSASSNAEAHWPRGILLRTTSTGGVAPEIDSSAGFVPTGRWGPVAVDRRARVYQVGDGFVERFDSAGKVDRLYGTDGAARMPKGFAVGSFLVRDDGTALAVGAVNHSEMSAAFRLTPDGSPDQSFGHSGIAKIAFGPTPADPQSVAIDHQGRILLVGRLGAAAAVVRLLPNGRLDRQFARRGRLVNLPTRGADVTDVALQADGKILIAASPSAASGSRLTTLVRLRRNGGRDRSFGHEGVLHVARMAKVLSVFTSPRQIVLVSQRGFSGESYGVALRAFELDGSVDQHFGREGVMVAKGSSANRTFRPVGAARQPNGRIVVVGTGRRIDKPGSAVVLLRFR